MVAAALQLLRVLTFPAPLSLDSGCKNRNCMGPSALPEALCEELSYPKPEPFTISFRVKLKLDQIGQPSKRQIMYTFSETLERGYEELR